MRASREDPTRRAAAEALRPADSRPQGGLPRHALILFLAFTSMASGPETDVKMMATGLAAGILVDATLIRALIVPAVITLMGRWN